MDGYERCARADGRNRRESFKYVGNVQQQMEETGSNLAVKIREIVKM